MSIWLVQIELSPHCHRLWNRSLLDGHAVHRDLMRLVKDNNGAQPRRNAGMLWRAEEHHNGVRILAQMTDKPLVERLADDLALTVQTRALDPLLDHLQHGTRVRYRIAANATKRHGKNAPDGKAGKLANLHGTQADDWWRRKAEESGLDLIRGISAPQPAVLGPQTTDQQKNKRKVSHGVTRFDGTAQVTDSDRLRTAVRDGIGRARTYGCGLLSVGPV